ncbi:MAG: cytochrome c-type biogenesis protein CcmH [Bdellovibrionota bacterium]
MVPRFVILKILLLLFVVNNACAEDPQIKAKAEKIYSTVLSPYCPGRLLSHCPSSSADQLKLRIYEDLNQGKSNDQIINELYAEFGEDIRATPEFSGFGIIGWLMPALFLLIGFLLIFRFVKKQKE